MHMSLKFTPYSLGLQVPEAHSAISFSKDNLAITRKRKKNKYTAFNKETKLELPNYNTHAI